MPSVWFSAPPDQASLANSWSSQMAMTGAARVQGLEVGVGFVTPVPGAVVGEGGDLVGRGVRAYDGVAGAVLAGRVLVDVVAEVQPGVQVAARREMAVRGEVARLPVGAGDHAEAQAGHGGVGRRGGAGAGGGRVGAAGGEAEPVVGGRPQAADVRLDGVVGGGRTRWWTPWRRSSRTPCPWRRSSSPRCPGRARSRVSPRRWASPGSTAECRRAADRRRRHRAGRPGPRWPRGPGGRRRAGRRGRRWRPRP